MTFQKGWSSNKAIRRSQEPQKPGGSGVRQYGLYPATAGTLRVNRNASGGYPACR